MPATHYAATVPLWLERDVEAHRRRIDIEARDGLVYVELIEGGIAGVNFDLTPAQLSELRHVLDRAAEVVGDGG